jgi:hypothetical protein
VDLVWRRRRLRLVIARRGWSAGRAENAKQRLPGGLRGLRVRWRAGSSRFYALIFLLSLWLTMGGQYGLWQYVHWLPGFNFIRAPSRFIILGVLVLAVLAGYGFEWLTRRFRLAGARRPPRRSPRR